MIGRTFSRDIEIKPTAEELGSCLADMNASEQAEALCGALECADRWSSHDRDMQLLMLAQVLHKTLSQKQREMIATLAAFLAQEAA